MEICTETGVRKNGTKLDQVNSVKRRKHYREVKFQYAEAAMTSTHSLRLQFMLDLTCLIVCIGLEHGPV